MDIMTALVETEKLHDWVNEHDEDAIVQRIWLAEAEADRLREELEAYKGAAADLAQSGLAERDALRKVIALLSKKED